jgi:phosphate-selective porin OprO/OprP
VRLNRYENTVVEGRGDRYDEIYAGLNLFFYGHKFKWQTGVTWANMADKASDSGAYEGWALATGIRVYW